MMFGAKASWFQKFLDWDKLTFGDMIDQRRGFIYQTGDVPRGNGRRGFFDASAGFVGFGKGFYFGGAVHHLNRPDESMILGQSRLPMRFTGHAGADIAIGSKGRYASTTSIMPNIIYQYQNGFQELSIGTYIKYGNFTVGAWLQDAVLGIKVFSKWNRAAIISDTQGIKIFTELFSKIMIGEFKCFNHDELNAAITWVSEEDKKE